MRHVISIIALAALGNLLPSCGGSDVPAVDADSLDAAPDVADSGRDGDDDSSDDPRDAEDHPEDTDVDEALNTNLSAGLVRTTNGHVQGTVDDGLGVYLGIPYAAPPIGALRWRPPEPAQRWEGVREATSFGPICPQIQSPVAGGIEIVPGEFSEDCPESCEGDACCKGQEDCLTVNVWTPAQSTDDALPILVWIHGGGWNIGSGSQAIYDGTNLARQHDVVVVTFNYRLGPLGFLAHAGLSDESPANASGNYGMLDQVLLLNWIQDNAQEFGGSPQNVTIFGESAGGGSVCHLVASPLGAGLFHRGVIQSASCPDPVAMRFLDRESPIGAESAETLGDDAAAILECTSSDVPAVIACMRGLTAGQLYQTLCPSTGAFVDGDAWFPRLWPIVDGHFLHDATGAVISDGLHNHVPIIGGTNSNEMGLWRLIHTIPILGGEAAIALLLEGLIDEAIETIDPDAMRLPVVALFGLLYRDRILELYPPGSTGRETVEAYERLLTDLMFACPTRRYMRALAGDIDSQVWLYHFTRVPQDPFALDIGAIHGLDIQYVFGNLDMESAMWNESLDEDDAALSTAIMGYWARFSRTGDPNGDGAVEWLDYDGVTDSHLELDAIISPSSNLNQAGCNLIDEFRAARCESGGTLPLACAI